MVTVLLDTGHRFHLDASTIVPVTRAAVES
jgi:hypothetical protein